MNKDIKKIKEEMINIKINLYDFLKLQQSNKDPTYFRYSMSGDLWNDTIKWNVQSRVFATKIAYTIGIDRNDSLVQNAISGIKQFRHKDGYIYDDMLLRRKKWIRFKEMTRNLSLVSLTDYEYIRAESRQCYSALLMYKELSSVIPVCEVRSGDEIDKFLNSLNWKEPWAAGSHFSHLMFFERLAYESKKLSDSEYKRNIEDAYEWIKHIENPLTGSWCKGTVSAQQSINGAMKIITGLHAVGMTELLTKQQCKKLIDLCLGSINNMQACDNFNIVYVLYHAGRVCTDYRRDETMEFAIHRYNTYLEYYFPTCGGFSFTKGGSNIDYYGCPITLGKNEPDLHGTALFVCGLFYLACLLNINEDVGLKEVIS